MKCQICQQNPATVSAVIDGVYYKHLCHSCKSARNQISSGHARWARSVDLEDHEADIQQPYNADGTVNADFARLYPDKARAIFSEKQIRDANRN